MTVPIHKPKVPLAAEARNAGVVFALFIATFVLVRTVHEHYPLQHWLFWRYAGYWLAAGLWSLACLALGHLTLSRIPGLHLGFFERLAIAQALGVFEFQLLLFVAGVAQLYGPLLFFTLPLLMLAAGAPGLLRYLRRAGRLMRAREVWRANPGPLLWLLIGFGIVSLLAVYLPTMLPANSSYDSRWRHMMMAEQYVVHGGIRPFREGWIFGTGPQFSSLLYAWPYMLPFGKLFDRVELCAHLEYVLFLWTTLVGLPALVRRVIPRANPAAVWVARFAFPGVLLYDSSLSVGTDHLGAVFAAPLFLLCLRAWRGMNPWTGMLLGVFVAAALCSKESSALLLAAAPVFTVALRFAIDVVRLPRRDPALSPALLGSLAAGGTSVLLTTPYWLRNLAWYGDPVYPNLHGLFPARPWDADSSYIFQWAVKSTMMWKPGFDLQGLEETLYSLVTLFFKSHSWWSMHRDVPIFGFLFTLLILVLPFLRGSRRIWLLVGWVHGAIFVWFWVHHEERHLQTIMPWMAAAVAAICTLLWRSRRGLTRGLLAVLIGLQLVWGADVFFYPTHSMVGTSPIKALADMLAYGFQRKYSKRFDYQHAQQAVGALLPPNARLLVHERRDHLGIGRTTVTDFYGDQYGINYARLRAPKRVLRRLRRLGITHLAWKEGQSQGFEPLAGDIVFFEFALRHGLGRRRAGAYRVARMPRRLQQLSGPFTTRKVAVLGCGSDYPSGIYRLWDLRVPRFGPRKRRFPAPRRKLGPEFRWSDEVFAVAVESGCEQRLKARTRRLFERAAVRAATWGPSHEIWLRRR